MYIKRLIIFHFIWNFNLYHVTNGNAADGLGIAVGNTSISRNPDITLLAILHIDAIIYLSMSSGHQTWAFTKQTSFLMKYVLFLLYI